MSIEGSVAIFELGATIALLGIGETESCVNIIGRATVHRSLTPIPQIELLGAHFEAWYYTISKTSGADFSSTEIVGVAKSVEQENVWYIHVRLPKK